MKPISTPHCNFTYTRPAGTSAEQCGDLPCLRDAEIPLVMSWWLPTEQERLHIARGGLVVLTSRSFEHAPVSLSACLPE